MLYYFYILLGILPSLIWLCFFLRKDAHPESNPMVLKIFFLGMLSAVPAAFIEIGFSQTLFLFKIREGIFFLIIYWFLGIALVEEVMKYLVVRKAVFNDPELDEPIDAILYMIIAALGFAALENILILWPREIMSQSPDSFLGPLIVSVFRFWGATFLHALCSGLVGFFVGLTFFKKELRAKLTILGLVIATFLHGLYNFSITSPDLIYRPLGFIIEMKGNLKFLIPTLILIGLAALVLMGFKKLEGLKSSKLN